MKSVILIFLISVALLLIIQGTLARGLEGTKESSTTRPRSRYVAQDKSRNLLNWVRRRMNYILKPKTLRNFWEGWRFIKRPITRPWWKGPNVCDSKVKTKAITPLKTHEGSRRSEHCKDLDDAYRCLTSKRTGNGTESIYDVKECCKGFTRSTNDYGCPKEIEIKNITATLNEHGLTSLLRAFESIGILSQLDMEDITVFAPSNAEFENLSRLDLIKDVSGQKDFKSMVAVNKYLTDQLVYHFQNILLNHVINTEITTHRMYNEQLIMANNSLQSSLRINIDESKKIITINCKNITSRNIMASNGIIHVVDGLLKPVTESLDEVIAKHPQLSYFRKIYDRSWMNTAFAQGGHYTVFAPTNDAFNDTERLHMQDVLNNIKRMTDLLHYHMIPNVICPIAIEQREVIPNMSGKNLTLNRDINGTIFVNDVKISDSYIMARNGILYLIDDVILPKQEFNVLSVAEKENATIFLDLINGSQLELDLKNAVNIQVFIPSNEAFKALETSNTSLLQDTTTLENILRYHVSPSWNEEWYNNYQMDTWVSDRQIRLNSYVMNKRTHGFSHHWTAQCSPIIKSNLKSDNGVVHIVDKVLLPPKGTIIDVLKADGRFSDFVRYIEDAGMSETLEKEGPFTLFAYTDKKFTGKMWNFFGRFHYTPAVKGMVRDHIANDLLCCAGISDGRNEDKNIQSYSRYRHLNLFKNSSTITVRKGKIVECDIMATNGVIHVFDNSFYPRVY